MVRRLIGSSSGPPALTQSSEMASKDDAEVSHTSSSVGQEEFDAHDTPAHCGHYVTQLPFLRKRSKIVEIVSANDIVFALSQAGVCAAFSRETNQKICFLNGSPDEAIRSLFYNKNNDSIITVSVNSSDNFSSLICRSTRIEYILRGQPDAGFALFESESLKWLGFVEFDDVNGKVLTYSAHDSIYKVFDLKNYTLLYTISEKDVEEIKIRFTRKLKKFAFHTGVKVAVAYGGAPMHLQLRELERGVDILVVTPGRLVDLIERCRVSLRNIKYLALDEADRMLDMGFEPQIRKIVQQMDMPPPGTRQTMLFSATFPNEIQHALTLVFVETKRGADSLENWLSMNGFHATVIHGDRTQPERERALNSFKRGWTPIVVATDVAARGLDIPHISHVINFDLPKDIDDYVHRIGRTGRAGKSGLATAFFNNGNLSITKALAELMQEANQEVPEWLSKCAERASLGNGGGRNRRSGGSRFGGHDFRKDAFSRRGNTYYCQPYGEDGGLNNLGVAAKPYYTNGYNFGLGTIVATGWE